MYEEASKRKALAVRALRSLLVSQKPLEMDAIFMLPGEAYERRDSPNRAWQNEFMASLIGSGIVQEHSKNKGRSMFVLKNPDRVIQLLKDENAGGDELAELVTETSENAQWSKTGQSNVTRTAKGIPLTSKPFHNLPSLLKTPESTKTNVNVTVFGLNDDMNVETEDGGKFETEEETEETEESDDESETSGNEVPPTYQWPTVILDYVEATNKQYVSTSEIAVHALKFSPSNVNVSVLRAIGGVLRNNGWRNGKSKPNDGSRPIRIWIRKGSPDPQNYDLPGSSHSEYETESNSRDSIVPTAIPGVQTITQTSLDSIQNTLSELQDLQARVCENLIYVRDSVNTLHDRMESLETKLDRLEADRSTDLDSALVNSMRKEVRAAMEEAVSQIETGRSARAMAAAGKLSSEIASLRDLIQNAMDGDEDE